MKLKRSFFQDTSAGPAAEFALVLPIALLFFFGIIDVGRYMWEVNRAEKATQIGARVAVVTQLIPTNLATTNFVTGAVLQGDPVPLSSFSGTRCTAGACSTLPTGRCTNGTSGSNWGYDSAAFNDLVTRMRQIAPAVSATNVVIEYLNVGLGYAGDPNGPDVAPLISIRVCGLRFVPITTQVFGVSTALPDFSYSLTMEDGLGARYN